jgi:hypothetical protein
MPNIYITDETKDLLEKVSAADCRGQDGEINYLLKQRIKELGLPAGVTLPSSEESNSTNPQQESQENSKEPINA